MFTLASAQRKHDTEEGSAVAVRLAREHTTVLLHDPARYRQAEARAPRLGRHERVEICASAPAARPGPWSRTSMTTSSAVHCRCGPRPARPVGCRLDGVLEQVTEREGRSLRIDLHGAGARERSTRTRSLGRSSERAIDDGGGRRRPSRRAGPSRTKSSSMLIRRSSRSAPSTTRVAFDRSGSAEILDEELSVPLERRERVPELVRDDGGCPSERDELTLAFDLLLNRRQARRAARPGQREGDEDERGDGRDDRNLQKDALEPFDDERLELDDEVRPRVRLEQGRALGRADGAGGSPRLRSRRDQRDKSYAPPLTQGLTRKVRGLCEGRRPPPRSRGGLAGRIAPRSGAAGPHASRASTRASPR